MKAQAAIVIALLYVLHQDFWFWSRARPLVLGFLPIGLFYHAAFTVVCSLVLWWLAVAHWPSHLEAVEATEPMEERPEGSGPTTPSSPAE